MLYRWGTLGRSRSLGRRLGLLSRCLAPCLARAHTDLRSWGERMAAETLASPVLLTPPPLEAGKNHGPLAELRPARLVFRCRRLPRLRPRLRRLLFLRQDRRRRRPGRRRWSPLDL